MKQAKDAQTKGAKDAGGDTEATKIKEPLAAGDQVDHDGEELEEARMTKVEMINAMKDKGFLMSNAGALGNVVKIRPPMPFNEDDARLLVATMDKVLEESF